MDELNSNDLPADVAETETTAEPLVEEVLETPEETEVEKVEDSEEDQ